MNYYLCPFFWVIIVILFYWLAKEGDEELGGEGEEYRKTEEKLTAWIKTWARKIDSEAKHKGR